MTIDLSKDRCRKTYTYFNQGNFWLPDGRPAIDIAGMEPGWRLNCTRWLERRAGVFTLLYNLGETVAMAEPRYQEADNAGEAYGRTYSEMDLMSDMVLDDFDRWGDERTADPVSWIRSTTLYRALAKGLPTDGKPLQELAASAKHWSTCPARTGAGNCCCEQIRTEAAAWAG